MNNSIFFLSYPVKSARRNKGWICNLVSLLTMTLIMLFSSMIHADDLVELRDIKFSTLPGNNVELVMGFSAQAPAPQTFTMDNPARIIMDFPKTQLALDERQLAVNVGQVKAVSVAEANDRVRLVVDLLNTGLFSVQQSDNFLIVSVGSGAKGDGGALMKASYGDKQSMMAEDQAAAIVQESRIEGVDFQRSENGSAQVVITLNDPSTVIDMQPEAGKIILKFHGARLPERLDRRLDVIDFATPVLHVDSHSDGGDTRIEIDVAGSDYDHMAYQTNNTYVVEVKQRVPKQEDEEIAIEDKTYNGELLSLDFQKIDVRAALYLLADYQGKNVVADPSKVSGDLTLKLKNVPWDQALDIILDNKGLGIREIGNVWSIEPQADIDARRKSELAAKKEIKELEPLRTEFIQVNYSKAEKLKTLLSSSGGGDKDSHSFLSSRGAVSVDERTNTLLIQDTADKITEVRKLISELDRPVRQVLISSRIVIASNDFGKDLGVRFGQSTNYTIGNRGDGWGVITGGKLPGDTTFPAPTAFQSSGEGYLLDLPANPAFGLPAAFGLAVGKIGTYLLQLELSALESDGRGEIVSSPRVVTANQQQATIKQGVEVAVQGVAGANAAAEPTFKEAVLELKVTPQITPDDRVIMDLKITKDDIQAGGNFGKREVQTQVLVDNGETVVLGGVYEQTSASTVERVPFFGELPIVGALFRRTHETEAKQELLIFVTPKILKESAY